MSSQVVVSRSVSLALLGMFFLEGHGVEVGLLEVDFVFVEDEAEEVVEVTEVMMEAVVLESSKSEIPVDEG
jgi:hypothetical protein